MPLQLTTAASGGAMDNGTYTHVKVVRFDMDLIARRLDLEVQYGNLVEGAWVSGPDFMRKHYEVRAGVGETWDALMAVVGSDQETVYNAVSRTLYQWLIDSGSFQGTIV